jgi:NAD(P)-dependent dehydrogenase (short-subunit alcohol dehydrogenase family)
MADPSSPPAVLITGASTGIGAACALDLDRHGCRVFAGVRKTADGDGLRGQASERLRPVLLDVTDAAAIRAAVDEVAAAVGAAGLAGLVNNAGILVPGPLELLPTGRFREQLEVNVLGTHAVTRAFLPLVRAARGRIVILGSISGKVTPPYLGAYAASKHALEALADALRIELRKWDVAVSIVEPDSVDTPIWDKLLTSADQLDQDVDAAIRQLYQDDLIEMRKASRRLDRAGMPVERVVAAVRHALLARRPKTRYPVGLRTRLALCGAALLPDRLLDWFLLRFMGIHQKRSRGGPHGKE